MGWYEFFKVPFRALVKYGYHGRTEGEENIPQTGPVILAGNHIGAADTFVMPALIKRRVTFPAKAEIFSGKGGIVPKLVAWFVKAVGQVPLDRSGGRASADGLGPILEVLANGGVAGIFPEGSRSPDGRMFKGKTGVARLALESGAVVIPVGVIDTEFTGKRLGIPWATRPLVRFGEPLDFSAYAGAKNDRATLRWVTDEIMAAVQSLTGQTYVDAYSTSVKFGGMTPEETQRRTKPRPGGGPAPTPRT
ncbi:MAG: lysophospholipid acyltransferase family protein [Propioniciclava sp.]|uniref:lysophospholipid acyltransferase family protein n=1 Tax=Propioniciclava sp. TaxID=2038686 RepID=UPI0039E4F2B4